MATRIIVHNITKDKDELYTIIPAYFKSTPCGISKKDRRIFYKDELIKKMLSLRVGSSFKWMDDDEDLCTYLLIEKVEI